MFLLRMCGCGPERKRNPLREPLAGADHLVPTDPLKASASGPDTILASDDESVSLMVSFTFDEAGDSVLNATAGEIAVALREDWLRITDPWVWVRIDNQEGWVPRSFLKLV